VPVTIERERLHQRLGDPLQGVKTGPRAQQLLVALPLKLPLHGSGIGVPPIETEPGENAASLFEAHVADKVESVMRELAYDLVFKDAVGNVIGVVVGREPESLVVLNSHMDTVRPDTVATWSRYPFCGDIVGNRIVGVGASDCKGGLASQVFAAHALARSDLALHRSVVVAATVAEENGCSVGVRHLLESTLPHLSMKPEAVLLGEPTGLSICHGHDGWVRVDIDVTGTSPEAAFSAAEHLFALVRLHCDDDGPTGRRPVMTASGPVEVSSSDGATIRVEVLRRLFHGESAAGVVKWLDRVAAAQTQQMHSVAVDVRVHEEEQRLYTGQKKRVRLMTLPWSTSLTNSVVDKARESMLRAQCPWTPLGWELQRLGMGTAGGVVTSEFGLPTIGLGPGEESQAHSSDESVDIANLLEAVLLSAVLSHGLAAAPAPRICNGKTKV